LKPPIRHRISKQHRLEFSGVPTPRRSVPAFTLGRTDPPTLADVADPDTVHRVFKALSNEVRRGILAALHDYGGYLSSHDIARRFDIPWQGVSRHLRILTEAGLVECDVRRNERAYTLDRGQLRRVAGRWVMRVATEGTRDEEGTLVFAFDE
jgi:DNA-binding transcriptional ArsR family regulator